MRKSFVLFLFLIFAASGVASAQQNIRLNFSDKHVRGQSVLKLKQALRQQYPHIRLNRAELQRVVLVAKSKRGNGSAYLRVAGQSTRMKTVDGNPYDFNTRARDTFYRIPMRNPSVDSQGAWQIHLRGNIKVRAVLIKLRNRRPGPPRPARLSANCSIKRNRNIIRPKTRVKCDVFGRGAVSYAVKAEGITLWTGRLNPRAASQRFVTSKKKVIGGYAANFSITLFDRAGRKFRSRIR